MTTVVFAVVGQPGKLARSATEGFDQVYGFVRNGPIPIDAQQIHEARDAVINFVTSSAAGDGVVFGLSAAGTFLTGPVLMAVILFFFLKDGECIWQRTSARGTRLTFDWFSLGGGSLRSQTDRYDRGRL